MVRDRNRRYSLAQFDFSPTKFQGVAFSPQPIEDTNLFSHAVDKIEERRIKAQEQAAKLDLTFGEAQSKLYKDPEMDKWLEGFKQKYKEDVDAFLDLGDYGSAIDYAIRMGAEAASDKDLKDRMAASAERKTLEDETKKRINSGNQDSIDDATYRWWNETKNSNPTFDEKTGRLNANITRPLASIDFMKEAVLASSIVEPEQSSTATQSSSDTTINGETKGSTSYNSNKYTRKQKDAIIAVMEQRSKEGDMPARYRQQYNVERYNFEQEEKKARDLRAAYEAGESVDIAELESLEQTVRDMSLDWRLNGGIVDLETYKRRKIHESVYAEKQSYNRTETDTRTSSTYRDGKSNSVGGGVGYGTYPTQQLPQYNYKSPTEPGIGVIMHTDTEDMQLGVDSAKQQVARRFSSQNGRNNNSSTDKYLYVK